MQHLPDPNKFSKAENAFILVCIDWQLEIKDGFENTAIDRELMLNTGD